jgi:predicted RNA binding protein YcfA (HicA-like mRNA interferase family)
MIKLPSITGKELVRVLGKFGFVIVRTRGSHNILKHADGRQTVVPVHSGESIGPGLLA